MGKNRWDFSQQLQRLGPKALASSGDSPPLPLSEAQAYCRWVAHTHYENFQIASFLIPRPLRQDFYNIYAYCRWSDDLADEAQLDDSVQPSNLRPERSTPSIQQVRVELLAWWNEQLRQLYAGGPTPHPVMQALKHSVEQHDLPIEPFERLLDAFRLDQHVYRYRTLDELLAYCTGSANPVGELVLHLAGAAGDSENLRLSNLICTGLQLANFCQDMRRDAQLGRIYVPESLWSKHGVNESMLLQSQATPELGALLEEFVGIAQEHLLEGGPLAQRVPRWLSLDIRLFRAGGLGILQSIHLAQYDVWTRRPTLSKGRKLLLLLRELVGK